MRQVGSAALQMVNGGAHGEALTQALIGWPLAYMAACCYYSLFKLGMFSFYHVVPHATNSHSLLMNAAQARCQIICPAPERSCMSNWRCPMCQS